MDLDMDLNDPNESDDPNGDGEGVWSPDIEQCFREALLLFPPCGRRKHILQEEGGGKMYGRNELIARHIMMRTGKSRTRKQVSSHIQVLARRKAKAEAGGSSGSIGGQTPPICAASSGNNGVINQGGNNNGRTATTTTIQHEIGNNLNQQQQQAYYDQWVDRPIVTQKIRLVEFSAFIEHRNLPPTSMVNQQQQQQSIGGGGGSIPSNTLSGGGIDNQTSSSSSSLSLTTNAFVAQNQNQNHQPHNNHLHQQHQQQQHHHYHNLNNHNNHNNLNQLHHHHHQQQQQQPLATNSSSAGFIRHSYIQIDYTQAHSRQTNKLERIDISQIQDKFPEIGSSEGLYQRGPSDAFFLVKFWADLNNDYEYNINDQNSYFGFSSHFETVDPYKDITCSTKACSYGLQVVEKVEKIYGAFNSLNGRYSYDINRSPMCEFMIQFIRKLRQLPRATQMNSVLENFSVLQVITSESTSEILLCLAYVFEVASSPPEHAGPQYHVYKLTKD